MLHFPSTLHFCPLIYSRFLTLRGVEWAFFFQGLREALGQAVVALAMGIVDNLRLFCSSLLVLRCLPPLLSVIRL